MPLYRNVNKQKGRRANHQGSSRECRAKYKPRQNDKGTYCPNYKINKFESIFLVYIICQRHIKKGYIEKKQNEISIEINIRINPIK